MFFLCLLCLLRVSSWALPANASHHTLWSVQGASNTVYLLGSIHVLKPEDYPLPEILDEAFSNAPIAVFETDLGQMEGRRFQQMLMAKAQLGPGETLAEQLSPETFQRLHAQLLADGIAPDMFDHMQASIAAISLEVIHLRRLGYDPEDGVDRHYFRLARLAGKEILTLEPVESQINLVTQFSPAEREILMQTTLDDLSQNQRVFSELLNAWKRGDSQRLDELLHQGMRLSPALFQRVVAERNARWLPEVESLLHGRNDAVVIVGAGHLVGRQGLVEGLRKRGWSIRQD